MANFGIMQGDLQLLAMAKLLAADVGVLLNSCQRDEVESGWPWLFLLTNQVVNTVAPQSQGTASAVQGSPVINGIGTSFFLPPNAQSFINIGGSNIALPILSVQSGAQLTLTQPWPSQSTPNTCYSIITTVYSAPGFIEIYNIRQIIDLTKISREALNINDPARMQTGGSPSDGWAPAGFDSSGNVQFELSQVPASALPYVVEGKLGAKTMVNDNDLPQIPSSVLENKAMWKCAMALYAANGNARYKGLADTYYQIYQQELDKAQIADSRRQQQIASTTNPVNRTLDYFATHDLGR